MPCPPLPISPNQKSITKRKQKINKTIKITDFENFKLNKRKKVKIKHNRNEKIQRILIYYIIRQFSLAGTSILASICSDLQLVIQPNRSFVSLILLVIFIV